MPHGRTLLRCERPRTRIMPHWAIHTHLWTQKFRWSVPLSLIDLSDNMIPPSFPLYSVPLLWEEGFIIRKWYRHFLALLRSVCLVRRWLGGFFLLVRHGGWRSLRFHRWQILCAPTRGTRQAFAYVWWRQGWVEVGETIRGLRQDTREGGLRGGWGRTQLTGGLAVRGFRLQNLNQSAKEWKQRPMGQCDHHIIWSHFHQCTTRHQFNLNLSLEVSQ